MANNDTDTGANGEGKEDESLDTGELGNEGESFGDTSGFTEEQNQEQEDALESAFAEARGDEPPKPRDKEDGPSADDDDPGQAAVAAKELTGDEDDGGDAAAAESDLGTESDDVDDVDDDKPATITNKQLKEINTSLAKLSELETAISTHGDASGELRTAIDKINGKFGDINRKLTETGQPVKITKDSFKRLSEEFPDLVEYLAEDLAGVMQASPGIDREELMTGINEDLDNRFNTTRQELGAELSEQVTEGVLNYISPGWQEDISSEGFGNYLDTLSGTERQGIEESNNPQVVANAIRSYKQWEADDQAKKEEAAAAEALKNKKLEEAVEPKGGAVPSQSKQVNDEEAAMNSGFKQVRS